jgi:hypothetical protein
LDAPRAGARIACLHADFETRIGIDVHPRASLRIALDFLGASSYSSVHALLSRIDNGGTAMSRLDLSCLDLCPNLVSCSDLNWQTALTTTSHGVAGSRPLPRARLSTHSVHSELTMVDLDLVPIAARRLAPLALDAIAIAPALATRRSLAPSAAPITPGATAIASALATQRLLSSAPYRPARLAAIGGGGIVGAARRSPAAAIPERLEAI